MMGRLSLEDFMQEVKEKLQKRYKNLKVFTSEISRITERRFMQLQS